MFPALKNGTCVSMVEDSPCGLLSFVGRLPYVTIMRGEQTRNSVVGSREIVSSKKRGIVR